MSGLYLDTARTISKSSITFENQALYWERAGRLAAKRRLDLACCLQHQHDRLDDEFANLRASQSWLATQDSEEAACLLIGYVQVLAQHLRRTGLDAELLRWCKDGLQACDQLRQSTGWLLLLQSEAQSALGQWNEAMVSIQAAIEASQEQDPGTYARATLALGRLQLNRGDYRAALETLARAERLLSELSDYDGLATARSEIAAYYLNRKELDKALSLYLEVDQLCRRTGAIEASDHTLLMLGIVHRKKRDYEQAITYLQQLFTRSEARHNQGATATAAHHLAWVYLNRGDVARARRLCGRAIALYEELGDTRGLSDAYEQLGFITLIEGQAKEALPLLEQSLVMRRELGNQEGMASSLNRLAATHFRMGHLAVATNVLWQSLAIYQHLGILSHQRFTAILAEIIGSMVNWRRGIM